MASSAEASSAWNDGPLRDLAQARAAYEMKDAALSKQAHDRIISEPGHDR